MEHSARRVSLAGLILLVLQLSSATATDAASGKAVSGETVSFRRDISPALTKLGCSSGSCHGSFQGRGGFRLSLFGFDAAAD